MAGFAPENGRPVSPSTSPDVALLAAVPAETALLRERLRPLDPPCADLSLWQGKLNRLGIVLAHCGVGKANAAASTAVLLERLSPRYLLHFGCAGAYPGGGLQVGDLALASAETFGDEGARTPDGFLGLDDLQLALCRHETQTVYQQIPLAPVGPNLVAGLGEWARKAGVGFAEGPFVTVSTCSGTDALAAEMHRRTGGICESMEGAAVALACLRRGTPCIELRGISNLTENRDLRRWDLAAGCRIAQLGVLQLLEHLPEVFA